MMNRREFLGCGASGVGAVALAQLLGSAGLLGQEAKADLNGGVHHRARAKRVIHLFMNGGASPMDTFDYKPELEKRHGQKFDPGAGVRVEAATSTTGTVPASTCRTRASCCRASRASARGCPTRSAGSATTCQPSS